MKIIKGAILSGSKSGHIGFLGLMVPDGAIGPVEYEECPDEWFCICSESGPVVGREQGFICLSRLGYSQNFDNLKSVFSNKRGNTWEDFVREAELHFSNMEKKRTKKISQLLKKVEELEKVVI